jgi:nucleotide-binding universal stress UspA family protein
MMDALHVFHVPFYAPPHQPVEVVRALSEQYRDQGRKDLDKILELPRHKGAGVHITRHLTEGKPHEEICRFAEQRDADIIVMGTHGRTGLARLLLGSVAERVVRTSNIPVLTVPIPE